MDAQKVKILVVDDEERITRMVRVILERQGYEVIVANDGLTGVRLAQTENPSLVLLDLMMPTLDGYDVTEVLRAGEQTRDIPIIVLSAKSELQDDGESYRKGVNYYMQKPFRLKQYLSVVQQLLDDPGSRPQLSE